MRKRHAGVIFALALSVGSLTACSTPASEFTPGPGSSEKTVETVEATPQTPEASSEQPSVEPTPSASAEQPTPAPKPDYPDKEPVDTSADHVGANGGPNDYNGGPDCRKVKCMALTFDDGPGDHTAAVLDALKEAGVPATFFVLGRQVEAHPDLLRREVAEGHAVGAHSWSHPLLTKLGNDDVTYQLVAPNDAIESAVGFKPNFMRPPYGGVNHRVRKLIADHGLAAILWDVDTLDWKHHDLNKAMDYIHQQARPGSIILMHDVHEVAPQAVPLIVKEYKAKGFHFVTIPQMFAYQPLHPGYKYFSLKQVLK